MIHLGPLEPAERDKVERQIRMDMDEALARHINTVIREYLILAGQGFILLSLVVICVTCWP